MEPAGAPRVAVAGASDVTLQSLRRRPGTGINALDLLLVEHIHANRVEDGLGAGRDQLIQGGEVAVDGCRRYSRPRRAVLPVCGSCAFLRGWLPRLPPQPPPWVPGPPH